MKFKIALSALALAAAGPAVAEDFSGDAEAGAGVFLQCQTCHVVKDGEGNLLAGAAGMVGPNLYGIAGQPAGSVENFGRYSPAMMAAKDQGLVWTEENLVAYIASPNAFLADFIGDTGIRGSMPIGAPNEAAAANVAAFIASLD
ncbi:MAG: cytochrome C [Ponticaulis sp.]|nr:cytochrome C [Ponticaulis sp.]